MRDGNRVRLPDIRSLLLLFVLALGHPLAVASGEQRLVTIGSGSFGGVYFPAAGTLCRLLNRDTGRHGIRCVAETSRGSLQNIADLLNDRTDFGIVQTDVQADAVSGRGRYAEKGPQQSLRALFALHAEPITVLARLDAGASKFHELKQRRVALGQARSGTRATMTMLLSALAMHEDDFATTPSYGPQTAGRVLCENRIDAFAYVVGHPNHLVRGVSESCAIRIVSIEGIAVDKLLAQRPYLTSARIAGGLYVGVDEPVQTIGVRASVLSTTRMSDAVAYELTRAVADNLEVLGGLHPALAGLRIEDLQSGLTATMHPGASRYFTEHQSRPKSP